jgi:2-dehydropantoate 2-reductase
MRHAILGAGGIGGLLGATLARAGFPVILLMRQESIARYDGKVLVESDVLGTFEVDIAAAPLLEVEIDVLWITTKATGLASALELTPKERVGTAAVVPLLNGIDHVALLRTRYRKVIAGAIRVESERVAPGRIRQIWPFLRVDLAGEEGIAAELRAAGIDAHCQDDELSLLWEKLAFLAPVALATSAFDGPIGAVQTDDRYLGCVDEVLAVARAEGAELDEHALRELAVKAPPGIRSSMQKDVAAGRPPELDAIAGPIQRGGRRHGIPTPNTDDLARLVEVRAGSAIVNRAVRKRAAETD